MLYRHDNHTHLRHTQLRPDDPFRLVMGGQVAFVPKGGFRWVSGVWGENGIADRFLVPAKSKAEVALAESPKDSMAAFLALQDLTADEDSYLDVANRFGFLGVPRVHFHSDETPIQWGEPLSFWHHEVGLLHQWLEVWTLFTVRNIRALRKRLKELLPVPAPASVVPFALGQLVHTINAHLWPDVSGETNPTCLECGCACRRVSVKPHVSYAFRVTGEAVVPEVRPVGLLSAAWLGFGEVVSGQRRIRPCEVCGQWMDITDTARPTAKRMHERCAHARRVRRWRQAKRARGSEGQPGRA
jgi:hypothetical protein